MTRDTSKHKFHKLLKHTFSLQIISLVSPASIGPALWDLSNAVKPSILSRVGGTMRLPHVSPDAGHIVAGLHAGLSAPQLLGVWVLGSSHSTKVTTFISTKSWLSRSLLSSSPLMLRLPLASWQHCVLSPGNGVDIFTVRPQIGPPGRLSLLVHSITVSPLVSVVSRSQRIWGGGVGSLWVRSLLLSILGLHLVFSLKYGIMMTQKDWSQLSPVSPWPPSPSLSSQPRPPWRPAQSRGQWSWGPTVCWWWSQAGISELAGILMCCWTFPLAIQGTHSEIFVKPQLSNLSKHNR